MIQRRPFKKWLFISVLCGAHSFFWGVMTNANVIAMVLGLLTLALMFAAIESYPKYQVKRAEVPRLARALDGGVKFRCWLAAYIPLSVMLVNMIGHAGVVMVLGAPYMAELFIGINAMGLTRTLTGINLQAGAQPALTAVEHFVGTYLTTIFTGLAHTIILGIMCLLAYGVVRLRDRRRATSIDDVDAPQ